MDGRTAAAYRCAMESRGLRTRAVSLIAAYAVALQALLSAFAGAGPAVAGESFAVLCSDAGGDRSGHPSRHDPPCVAGCAALGHGSLGPLPSSVVAAIAVRAAAIVLAPARDRLAPRVAVRGPQAARAPPLA